jgi:threonine dehydratase
MPARGARLDVTVDTRDRAHAEAIARALSDEGYSVERIDTGAGGFEPI